MRFAIALIIIALAVAVAVTMNTRKAPSSTVPGRIPTFANLPRPAQEARWGGVARASPRAPSMQLVRDGDADTSGAEGHVGPLRVLGGAADHASLGRLREALVEIYPHLAACHEASLDVLDLPALDLELEMTVEPSTDDRSTIEADVLAVPGEPRPPEMIECMRAVLGSLELAGVRERLSVGYVLSFRPDPYGTSL